MFKDNEFFDNKKKYIIFFSLKAVVNLNQERRVVDAILLVNCVMLEEEQINVLHAGLIVNISYKYILVQQEAIVGHQKIAVTMEKV